MALSDRTARIVLGVLAGGLVVAALTTDLARRTGGEFWGDGATYLSMARSLAEDFDLRYEARDVLRVRREWKAGPQGVFLKRSSGGLRFDPEGGFPWISRVPRDEPRLYYAKAFVYPLVAAPFVRVFGTRGLLLVNVLVFALALALGYDERRRRGNDPLRSLVFVLVVFLATVAPLYLLWPTPEIFGLGLATAGLVATSAGRPLLAAFLFGVAVYLKPPNVFLALPLGIVPLLPAVGERVFGPGFAKRLLESVQRGALVAATALALYGLNALVTGEMNYQGGERKTFYGRFPLEAHDVTFDNAGFWMTTDHLGPLVEGQDEDKLSRKTGPLRAPEEIRASFLRNLGYFWVGRFGGVLAYFPPAFAAVVAFLVLGPRTRRGWLAFLSLGVSWLFYLWVIPDNWYGGGGTVGNRYFLTLLPLTLFLVPRGRVWPVAVFGAVVGAVFVAPMLTCAALPFPATGRARHGRAVPPPSSRADHAQRPLGLHRALAEEAALRLHRRPAGGACRRPGRVLPLLHGRRDSRQGSPRRPRGVPAPPGAPGGDRPACVRHPRAQASRPPGDGGAVRRPGGSASGHRHRGGVARAGPGGGGGARGGPRIPLLRHLPPRPPASLTPGAR